MYKKIVGIYILAEKRQEIKNQFSDNNKEKISQAIKLYQEGHSQNQIAKELHISRNTLREALINVGIKTNVHINQFTQNE